LIIFPTTYIPDNRVSAAVSRRNIGHRQFQPLFSMGWLDFLASDERGGRFLRAGHERAGAKQEERGKFNEKNGFHGNQV
jgi:hypothetical protein